MGHILDPDRLGKQIEHSALPGTFTHDGQQPFIVTFGHARRCERQFDLMERTQLQSTFGLRVGWNMPASQPVNRPARQQFAAIDPKHRARGVRHGNPGDLAASRHAPKTHAVAGGEGQQGAIRADVSLSRPTLPLGESVEKCIILLALDDSPKRRLMGIGPNNTRPPTFPAEAHVQEWKFHQQTARQGLPQSQHVVP
jgi:hypothetical protein